MTNKVIENLVQRSSISIHLRDPLWILLVFYIGIPLSMGFLTGWMQTGRAAGWSKLGSLYFWIPIWLTSWVSLELSTRLIHRLLGKYIKSFLVLLVSGSVMGSLAVWPIFIWHIGVSEQLFGASTLGALPLLEPTIGQTAARFFDDVFAGTFFWLAMNYIFAGPLSMKRFGYEVGLEKFFRKEKAQSPSTAKRFDKARPLFLRRVKKEIGQDVIAVSAEQHYLRVFTPLGNDLILYRLSDAILELQDGFNGLQVHRSHWVKLSAIDDVVNENRNLKIILSNGLTVPVGRSHQSKVRSLNIDDH